MSHDAAAHGAHAAHSPERRLVQMANQIGAFFRSQPADQAAHGIADHINKFWNPRMRTALLAHLERGGEGLQPLVRTALATVKRPAGS
jgi:formate dehydrogenase subunit delta